MLRNRNLTILFWLLAIALFAIEAWSKRFAMNHDGIQYLDDADFYLRGDWRNAANSQWSPGFPWLIGLFFRLLRPAPYWEFPAVHLVQFVVAVASLAAFQFFLSGLLRFLHAKGIQPWLITLIGFPVFLYTTVDFTTLAVVTADLLMHCFAYLVAGVLARVMNGEKRAIWFLTMGLFLGLGYLAKAPFLVYALFLFALLFAMLGFGAGAIWRVGLTVAAFVLVAGPYVAFLSHWKHRFTTGDSGRYNIAWMVDGIPYRHWQGGPPGSGVPIHPTRRISTDPPAYEFGHSVGGTYPPWFDPIYWNEGAKPRYRLTAFAASVVRSLKEYAFILQHRQVPLEFGLLTLALIAGDVRKLATGLASQWPLLAFGLMPFAMYALVHADPRFLSSFFTIVWLALFAAVLLASREASARVPQIVVGVTALLMLVQSGLVASPREPLHELQDVFPTSTSQHPDWDVAQALADLGLRPGDPVAIVGGDLPYFWARLARVHVVSEVLMQDSPCGGACFDHRAQQWERVKPKIAATGAKFIVSPCIHGVVEQPGWVALAGAGAFAYRF